ncbi:MAG TPA: ATP-binding cassette domain-containing protein [Pirellulales bacterium]|jgi:molybdate transport system ATP-binding protein|nr:ATP-binding cassette domain-containing protein [Pirellulales bacterium]
MSLIEFDCRLRYPSGFLVDAAFASDSPVTVLFGPSGSGKTSILSMIAGLRRPEAGIIRCRQRELFNSTTGVNLPPEARKMGYVFQERLLFPHLNVRENLLYGARRRQRAARTFDLQHVVDVFELGELLNRAPHTLSGGQRQRVALGRALLSGPELLLLDEPLVSIEDALKDRVLEFLQRVLAEWQVPTILVSHDATEVARLGRTVIELSAGRIVRSQPTEGQAKGAV